ncbi:amidase signature domain-containing protein [Xylariomycetidae sp. FL2044]|nr:amidase signature domain-containing protein [Xylariomycetidae sp. FL2044]
MSSIVGAVHQRDDISIAELRMLLDNGTITSRDLVELYLQRIDEVNDDLHAVIEINGNALSDASALDEERAQGLSRGPLHGIPILVKDSYATTDATYTGSGSVCLSKTRPSIEATVVRNLRRAGAVILGKTNLSEFNGVRGDNVPAGWSARGGQTLGAYVWNQTACGSSSGSGVAAGLGLAAAALGTETAGSITCPASYNNAVGIKPTVGLTSRFGVVPLTRRQDTTGPLAQSVADAARILDAMAGRDPHDNYTSAQPWDAPPGFATALDGAALRGKRLGVVWVDENILADPGWDNHNLTRAVFDAALDDMRAAGAELVNVEPDLGGSASLTEWFERYVGNVIVYVMADLKENTNEFLETVFPSPEAVHNVSELLECLISDDRELSGIYNHSGYDRANATSYTADSALAWDAYEAASTRSRRLITDTMAANGVDALVMLPDPAAMLSAPPGLPIVTVPMGALPDGASTHLDTTGTLVSSAPGIPLGLSFVADRWSDRELVGYAYAYEQVSRRRKGLTPVVKPRSDLELIM